MASALLLSGCRTEASSGGLQIDSPTPLAIYANGQYLGQTPYFSENVRPGDYTLSLTAPESSSQQAWAHQVRVLTGALTVVTLGQPLTPGHPAPSYYLTVEPLLDTESAQLVLTSSPPGAQVVLDGQTVGDTPELTPITMPGIHTIQMQLSGGQTQDITVQSTLGHRVSVHVNLEPPQPPIIPSPSPNLRFPDIFSLSQDGVIVGAPNVGQLTTDQVEVLSPTLGIPWVRVFSQPSTAAPEIAKVRVGTFYPLVEATPGAQFAEIGISPTESGFILQRYVKLLPKSTNR